MTQKKVLEYMLCCAMLALSTAVEAAESIKVGVLAEMSGTFADFGRQIESGIRVYMKQNGDVVAGRKMAGSAELARDQATLARLVGVSLV